MTERRSRDAGSGGRESDGPEGADREPSEAERRDRQRASAVASSAFTLIGSVLLGLGIGYVVDRLRDTAPRWTIICTLLFLVAGFYHVVKDAFK